MLLGSANDVRSRRGSLWLSALAVAICLAAGPGATWATQSDAPAFVQARASETINMLTDAATPPDIRRDQFQQLIRRNFDTPSIARMVLGDYAAQATPEQLAAFQSVFESALVQIYTDRFFDYDGDSLQLMGAEQRGDGVTVVRSTVSSPTGSETHEVDWWVVGAKGNLRFLDVVVDGVSTSLTTKDDYAAVLRASGGDLNDLVDRIRAKSR